MTAALRQSQRQQHCLVVLNWEEEYHRSSQLQIGIKMNGAQCLVFVVFLAHFLGQPFGVKSIWHKYLIGALAISG